MAQDKRICIGAFASAHGVRGEIKVKSFTADPADVAAYGPVEAEKGGATYTLKLLREPKPGLFVARVAELRTREDAEAVRGTKLYVARSKLPPPDEDEFYYEDLIGLHAVTSEGAPYGQVKAVLNHGAGDILELSQVPDVKSAVLIAFTKEAVPEIDFAAGQLTVVPPVDDPEAEDEEGQADA
jgi:16S rRNA processing protein RimM